MKTVELYGRPGCCLCDEAEKELKGLAAGLGFRVHKINIEADARLLSELEIHIPVVKVDGREVCRYRLDRDALQKALAIEP
ncbi:MAG: glutaredoxin family protein [Deltaproteobacteria bacterium]|nr:glutaredoxin family protein [Deltaproteobacteria bacterium]